MSASAAKPDHDKLLAVAVRRLERLEKSEAFDPGNPTSRPTPAQQAVLDDLSKVRHRYLTAGNQAGKSRLGCREVHWVWTETHPTWKRPKDWGDEKLLILVVGRTSKQVEEVLWRNISSYCDPGEFHIHRVGGIIQKVTHRPTGNVIILASHHADNEAREKLQAYVAHYVLCDEMPSSSKLFEELQRRVQARSGYFLATFTPKVVNQEIRRMVDAAQEPYAKRYRLSMLDNPIYAGREQEILASLNSFPESYRKTVLFGDWMAGDEAVYWFDYDKMVQIPPDYSPSWRHVESSDPASASALGLTIWAEDPKSSNWYCIWAEKIRGIAVPTELVDAVRQRTAKFNIIRRRSDAAPWYVSQAAAMGLTYDTIYNKHHRKLDLIKNLQEKMGTRMFLTPNCEELIQEFQECRWSDTGEGKIVNHSIYHLLDSSQYFADDIPAPDKTRLAIPHHQWLYEANEKRKSAEVKAAQKATNRITRNRRLWS